MLRGLFRRSTQERTPPAEVGFFEPFGLTPRNIRLSRKAYNEVFAPCFPDEDSNNFFYFIYTLAQQTKSATLGSNARVVFTLMGKNLDDPAKAEIHGLSHATYLKASQTAVINYLALHPDHRSFANERKLRGDTIERLSALAKADGKKLRGVFGMIHDPQVTEDKGIKDAINPYRRLKVFAYSAGAANVPVHYVEPSNWLMPEIENFLLVVSEIDGQLPEKQAVIDFLYDWYRVNLHKYPEKYPAFLPMIEQIRKMDHYVAVPAQEGQRSIEPVAPMV